MDKDIKDEKVKDKQDELEKKLKELRKLHLSIQDIKKGFSIAGHVIRFKEKDQYDGFKMNKNPKLLSVKNGMIDLETGELLERRPEHYQTFYIDIDYNEDADTSLMDKFIDNMFKKSEAETKRLLCSVLGYAVSGVADKKTIPIIVGDGENGKSELINIIKRTLGMKYMGTVNYNDLSEKNTNQNKDTLYNARLARLMIIIETKKDAQFHEADIKNIVGGDDVSVSAKYKATEQMTDECIPFIISNFKPKFSSDNAIWNRVLIIPLNMQFIDRSDSKWDEEAFEAGNMKPKDPAFIKELRNDKQGILRWIVKQCQSFFREGIIIPESIEKEKQNYKHICTRSENKNIKEYIESIWEISEEGGISITDMITEYRKDFKSDELLSDGQISSKIISGLKEIGAENKRINTNDGKKRMWLLKKREL